MKNNWKTGIIGFCLGVLVVAGTAVFAVQMEVVENPVSYTHLITLFQSSHIVVVSFPVLPDSGTAGIILFSFLKNTVNLSLIHI